MSAKTANSDISHGLFDIILNLANLNSDPALVPVAGHEWWWLRTAGLKARKDSIRVELQIAIRAEDRQSEPREVHDDAISWGPRWRERL